MSARALRHENNSDAFLTLGPRRCFLPSATSPRSPPRNGSERTCPFVPCSWGHAPCHEGRTGSGPPFVHGASSCRPLQGTVDRTFAILNPRIPPIRLGSLANDRTEMAYGTAENTLGWAPGRAEEGSSEPNAERRRSDPMGADYVSREVVSQCLVSMPSERATQVSQCCKIAITLLSQIYCGTYPALDDYSPSADYE
jgi:hypothetical protein